MRVLRLGTSNDDAGSVPEEQRGWKIAERLLAEAAGEPVQTTLKRAWPNEGLAPRLEGWLDEYKPDMVVLQVNNFWYGYESIPLWFERRLGRAGASLNHVGLKIRNAPWFADNRWAQLMNRNLLRVLPATTHFTVPEVAACMEGAMRKVLAHEGVVLLIRGNDAWASMPMASRGFNRRNAARNAAMSSAMRSVCERLRVPYVQRPVLQAGELETVNRAGWHYNADGERQAGEFDGQAMATAWLAVRS